MTLRYKTRIIIGTMFLSLIVILYFLSENLLLNGYGDTPREIYDQEITIAYLMLMIVGVGLVFGIVTIFLLEKQVLSRLSRLSNSIHSIGTSGDISARVSMPGADELSILAGTVNGMLAALQQSENELRQSEEHYRLLADNARDVIYTMDVNLRFTYVSPSVTPLTGYSIEEANARTLAEVLTPTSFDLAMKTFVEEQAIENMAQKDLYRSQTLELEVKRKDGSTVWVEARMTSLRDPDGQAIGILGVARDITERRRARQQIEHAAQEWRTTFDSISDLISIHDKDFKIVRVNKAFANAFKMKPQEVIGKTCYELMHGTKEPWPDCPHRQVLKTKKLSREEFFNSHLGIHTEVVCLPIFDEEGKVTAVVHIVRDITERKRAEEKLQELYNEEKDLRQELEEEISKRVEFTRALVHELKTPITPVMASSELLLQKLKGKPLLDLAENINQGAYNLNQRIDELLDLARGEIGMLQLNPEPVDLLPLLQRIANEEMSVALHNKQSLNVELPSSLPTVWADEVRFRQVVLNLMNNALKFTPAGGKITLRAKPDSANLIVEVQDTGRGISQEEQEQLFEPYHRLERDKDRLSGLGLGLSLSKKLVELHGGQIWVKSQKDKGSTFGFSIPLEATDQGEKSVETG